MSKYAFENLKLVVDSKDPESLVRLGEGGISPFHAVVKGRFGDQDERFEDLYEKMIFWLQADDFLLRAFQPNLCPEGYESALMLAVDDLGRATDQVKILALQPVEMRVLRFMQLRTFVHVYRETTKLDDLLR